MLGHALTWDQVKPTNLGLFSKFHSLYHLIDPVTNACNWGFSLSHVHSFLGLQKGRRPLVGRPSSAQAI